MFAVTLSKLRKAANGTDTPVATCMINKWMAKINEKEIYNENALLEGRRKKEKRKRRKTVAVPTTPESFRR